MTRQSEAFKNSGVSIPAILAPFATQPVWCVWRWVELKGKLTKPPLTVAGRYAKNNDPSTWCTLAEALPRLNDRIGLGLMLRDCEGLVALDIDKCRDKDTREIAPWAQQIVDDCNSYTEITPSGTGLRVIGTGNMHVHRKLNGFPNGGAVEIYAQTERYITVSRNVHQDGVADISAVAQQLLQDRAADISAGAQRLRRQKTDRRSEGLLSLISTPVEVGQRSDVFFQAVVLAKSEGLSQDGTETLMRAHPQGVAAKYLSPKDRLRDELSRAWEKAHAEEWLEPDDLTPPPTLQRVPLERLEPWFAALIAETAIVVQVSPSMVTGAVLSALSVAGQHIANVARSKRLQSPLSLFALTTATSGERKSEVDRTLTRGISQFERDQQEKNRHAMADHLAQMEIHKAKIAKLKKLITSPKKTTDVNAVEAELLDLKRHEPERPRVAKLLYHNATAEAIAWGLKADWPSAGFLLSEAGILLGGHSLQPEKIIATLTQFNSLWDGTVFKVDRRTSECFVVLDARLTLGLQVQPAVIRAMYVANPTAFRGSGFFARFLIAPVPDYNKPRPWLASTQTPLIDAFTATLDRMLHENMPTQDQAADSQRRVLTACPEAQLAWIDYYNTIDVQRLPGESYADVKDFVAKSADNCARIAGLLTLARDPTAQANTLPAMRSAIALSEWYMMNSKAFSESVALPPSTADALRLEAWLLERGGEAAKRDAQRLGPVRTPTRFKDALSVLQSAHRVRVEKRASGGPRKQEWLVVHPEIVSGEYQAPAATEFNDWTSEELARFASCPVPAISPIPRHQDNEQF